MLCTMTMLDMSTAHVSEETIKIFEKHPSRWPVSGWGGQYGAIIYAHDFQPDDCPADLWLCIEKCHAEGADYLRLDCDADLVPGLPVYQHD